MGHNCILYHHNTVVTNHFHSVKTFLFLFAKPCDFDGMLGTGLLLSMYTLKTPIDTLCKCHFNVTQLKEFSVKSRYQLNYFIISKTSLHRQLLL